MSFPHGETNSEHPPAPPKGPIGPGNMDSRLQQMEDNMRKLHGELDMERESRLRLEEKNEQLHHQAQMLHMSNNKLASEHRRLAQRFEVQ